MAMLKRDGDGPFPEGGGFHAPWPRRLVTTVAVLVLLVAVGAATSMARGDDPVALPPPAPMPDAMATRVMAAASSAPELGAVAPGSRRTVQRPSTWWAPEGACASEDEPRCAIVGVYDYATNQGTNVILTLDDPPQVVAVQSGVRVSLSPEEDLRGFEIAEGTSEVQALLAANYRRALSHEFAPGRDDPCAKVRCVAVDFAPPEPGELRALIIDLTNERVISRSWE